MDQAEMDATKNGLAWCRLSKKAVWAVRFGVHLENYKWAETHGFNPHQSFGATVT
jgi:hypothetical protein